ncbi:unnamed protein product [Calypogeia fissa]
MSLSIGTFGCLLCGASASTRSSPIWSSGGGCMALSSTGQGGRGGTVCLFPVLQVENLAAGYERCGRQNCAGTRSFIYGFTGEMISKSRSRVICQVGGGGGNLTVEDWTKKLPAKRKALYSHSLPCIEAWLHSLGFVQNKEDRAVWTIERPDWHAQLSLDVTDLYIRYLKKGPGNLDRDIERKFSYALSREDLENAILGGP